MVAGTLANDTPCASENQATTAGFFKNNRIRGSPPHNQSPHIQSKIAVPTTNFTICKAAFSRIGMFLATDCNPRLRGSVVDALEKIGDHIQEIARLNEYQDPTI